MYMEACEKEEARMRHDDDLRREVGLEVGKCLRVCAR